MLRWMFVAAAVGALLPACGSDSTSPSDSTGGGGTAGEGAPVTPLSPADFVVQAAAAVCAGVARCCGNLSGPYDDAQCKAQQTGDFSIDTEHVGDEGVTWDAHQAGVCVALLEQQAARCNLTDDDAGQRRDVCRRVTIGTKGPGAACAYSTACAVPTGGNSYCETPGTPSAATDPGVCVIESTPARAKAGEACALSCSYSTGTCTDATGKSQLLGVAPGPACFGGDNLICDSKTMTCKTRDELYPSRAGQPCPSDPDQCGAEEYCDAATSTCVSKRADGSPCDTTEFTCAGFCLNGVCGQVATYCFL